MRYIEEYLKNELNWKNISAEQKKVKYFRIIINSLGYIKIVIPQNMKESSIKEIINSRIGWIKKKLDNLQLKENFDETDKIKIFGKSYNIIVNYSENDSIFLSDKNLILNIANTNNLNYREKTIENYLNRLSLSFFKERLIFWSKKTSLKFNSFNIKTYKSCWGNCHTKKRHINLNSKLINCKKEFIDYVILHEISHLKFAGHGKDFYDFLQKYMPDYKKNKKLF